MFAQRGRLQAFQVFGSLKDAAFRPTMITQPVRAAGAATLAQLPKKEGLGKVLSALKGVAPAVAKGVAAR